MEKTVNVLEHRLGEAFEFLRKMQDKAEKYGCTFTFSAGEAFEDEVYIQDWDGELRKHKVSKIPVTFTSEAPKAGEYEFLAHLEITPQGVFVDTVPGVEDLEARFRHTDSTCQHCFRERNRRDLYVVRGTDGEQKQVGRSCLQDYLGVDPERIVNRFAFFKKLNEFDEEMQGLRGGGFYESTDELLKVTATMIRLHGWASRANSEPGCSTYDMVIDCFTLRPNEAQLRLIKEVRENMNDSDRETALAAREFGRNMAGNNEYEHNMKMLCAMDSQVDPKRVPLLISVVSSYNRFAQKQRDDAANRDKAVSKHIGSEGERLRDLHLEVTKVNSFESNFGETIIFKFVDDAGNIFTWFTGYTQGLVVGSKVVLDGTVKGHNEFNGVPETLLTRCKIKEVKA